MRSCLIVVLAGTGMFILVACAEPPERGPEVPVAFTMKDVSTANTTVSSLPDGRVQIRIEHDLIRGVTPEMLMWFYENVPTAKVEVGGRLYPLYHIWHPGDHVSVAVITPAPSGSPGLGLLEASIHDVAYPIINRLTSRAIYSITVSAFDATLVSITRLVSV